MALKKKNFTVQSITKIGNLWNNLFQYVSVLLPMTSKSLLATMISQFMNDLEHSAGMNYMP